jgi:hypothetical protein
MQYLHVLFDTLEESFLRQVMDPPPAHSYHWEKTDDLKKATAFIEPKSAIAAAIDYPCRDTVVIRTFFVRDPEKCTIGIEG